MCHLALGKEYLKVEQWEDAKKECSLALGVVSLAKDAEDCVNLAKSGLEMPRRYSVSARAELVVRLVELGSFEMAKKELDDLQKLRIAGTDKLGPLTADEENKISSAETALAGAVEGEWPRNLIRALGFREGTPRVLSWVWTAIEVGLLTWILYLVALGARFLRRRGIFFHLDENRPVDWTVSSILDDTKQSAAGAVMDGLNVYYNPLFQKLPTSSFLAVPVGLMSEVRRAGEDREVREQSLVDSEISVWRDFLRASNEEREFLSTVLEKIEVKKFARHRFKQVKAFDDFNLKVGGIEATPGAILRGLRRWWEEGWPSVSGAVTIETVNTMVFANVRLIASVGDLRQSSGEIEMPPGLGVETTLETLFSNERTVTVFASTQIDQYTDAVALASHRAAFRLLFRLVRPNEPNLAISASSYRQGVRLLTTAL